MTKKLTVLLSDDLDDKFRKAVFKAYGFHKGSITKAVAEALENWINGEATQK
jgi:hypothetical protein